MFWTDWKAGVVESSDLDGSGRSILASKLMWPNALAIDPLHQRVYWMEASTDTLESVKYDGTDKRVCDYFYKIILEKKDMLLSAFGLRLYLQLVNGLYEASI